MPQHPSASHPRHPLANKTRVLLSSVFGPYGQDDQYGSRKKNPMELYQNQVTRLQGGFSLRMFHRSFGLMMIQANIDAPCTLLDFPTLERFEEEVSHRNYDVIGISQRQRLSSAAILPTKMGSINWSMPTSSSAARGFAGFNVT